MNPAKLAKLQAQVRTGGKGSVRRKKKTQFKQSMTDNRLNGELKRLGLQQLTGIDEVNFFFEDDKVIRFNNPKLQASVPANTFCVSGKAQQKTITELMPDILKQVGHEKLQQYYQSMQAAGGAGGIPGMPGGFDIEELKKLAAQAGADGEAGGEGGDAADDDDDIPDLVEGESFDKAAE